MKSTYCTRCSAEGYHTVLAGLQHIARDSADIGFDEIIAPPKSTFVDDVAPRAVEFINSDPDKPFFMDVGFFETHRNFPEMGPDDNPNFLRPPAPVPDTPETRVDMAEFCTMARKLDEGVGMVLDALDESGLPTTRWSSTPRITALPSPAARARSPTTAWASRSSCAAQAHWRTVSSPADAPWMP